MLKSEKVSMEEAGIKTTTARQTVAALPWKK